MYIVEAGGIFLSVLAMTQDKDLLDVTPVGKAVGAMA